MLLKYDFTVFDAVKLFKIKYLIYSYDFNINNFIKIENIFKKLSEQHNVDKVLTFYKISFIFLNLTKNELIYNNQNYIENLNEIIKKIEFRDYLNKYTSKDVNLYCSYISYFNTIKNNYTLVDNKLLLLLSMNNLSVLNYYFIRLINNNYYSGKENFVFLVNIFQNIILIEGISNTTIDKKFIDFCYLNTYLINEIKDVFIQNFNRETYLFLGFKNINFIKDFDLTNQYIKNLNTEISDL